MRWECHVESHAIVQREILPLAGKRVVRVGERGRVISECYDANDHDAVRLEFPDGHEAVYARAIVKFG